MKLNEDEKFAVWWCMQHYKRQWRKRLNVTFIQHMQEFRPVGILAPEGETTHTLLARPQIMRWAMYYFYPCVKESHNNLVYTVRQLLLDGRV